MKKEIERKFIVKDLLPALQFMPHCSYDIWQYYLNESIRIRVDSHSDGHEEAYFVVKKNLDDSLLEREEYITALSVEQAFELVKNLKQSNSGIGVVRKTRHLLRNDADLTWEIDIFHGDNEGLMIAEIEIPSVDYNLDIRMSSFLGKEITGEARYYNCNLAKNPYKSWSSDSR